MNAATALFRSVMRGGAALSSGPPKRPPSSYMLFTKAQRAAGAVDTSVPVPAQGKALGAAWRALDPSAKTPFEAEYARLRAAYTTAVTEYTEIHGHPPPSKGKAPPKAKRAPSAYNLFMGEALKSEAGAPVDRMKAVSARWRAMEPHAKAPYEARAAQAKAAMAPQVE